MRTSVIALAAIFLVHAESFGQTPIVHNVYRDATFAGPELSPGVRAFVNFERLGAAAPKSVAVEVGGRPVPVLIDHLLEEGLVLVQVPMELAPGPTALVLIVDGVKSPPFNVHLNSSSPGLFHYTRFSKLIPFEKDGEVSCVPGETAAPGDTVRVRAVGLGITSPIVPAGEAAPSTPPAATVVMPTITVGGHPAEVLESVLEPGEIGIYLVTFRVPDTEARGWQTVVLRMGDYEGRQDLPLGPGITTFALGLNRLQGPAAPESLVVSLPCGGVLTIGDLAGDSRNPSTLMGGAGVMVKDSAGTERPAPVFRVHSDQIWYMIPAGTATGPAIVTATATDGMIFHGALEIQAVVPGVAGQRYWGDGIPSAMIVRVRDGVQTIEPAVESDAFGNPSPAAINMGPDKDQLYLMLFGTGFRHRSSLENVSLRIGAENTQVEYAGAQGEFAGLDQVNAKLPRSLAGSGLVPIHLTVDGKAANVTFLYFE